MKIYYLVIILLVSPLIGFSQAVDSEDEVQERMPEFIGGQGAMFNFLGENIQYPEKARLKGKEGKVYVTFVIDKDGTIKDVEALKKVHPLLDAEAVRLIKSMPKWTPGMQKGEAVAVSYNIPINFTLSGKEKKKLKELKKK